MAEKNERTNVDDLRGRAKRAYGELTDDKTKRDQGTIDRASGKLKAGIDTVRDKANEFLERNRKK